MNGSSSPLVSVYSSDGGVSDDVRVMAEKFTVRESTVSENVRRSISVLRSRE